MTELGYSSKLNAEWDFLCYFDIFMVAIVGALIALAAVIVLGSAFGSF